MARQYILGEEEALLAHKQLYSHCLALHNWIATAVESGNHERATELVKELRTCQALTAKLNVEVHRSLDRMKK